MYQLVQSIILVGLPGSGKTTARQELERILHVDGYEASFFVKKIISHGEYSHLREMHDSLGRDVAARCIYEEMKKRNQSTTIISGFRTIEEIDYISSKVGVFTIALQSPRNTLVERLQLRNGLKTPIMGIASEKRITNDLDYGLREIFSRRCNNHVCSDTCVSDIIHKLIELLIEKRIVQPL